MRVINYGARLGLALAAILAGSLSAAAPANAASSPVAACGGGSYHVIDSRNLDGYATVYLLYNGRTNCVVTWKKLDIGTRTWTSAWVGIWGTNPQVDDAQYAYYAGPVKVDAPGKCIVWGGSAQHNGRTSVYSPNNPSHCG
ncbi:hypothetical protein [Nocardia cyriacigeorgica]|jgi:hypothetical protein|uniref:hypothetical protein n=1 Tax=Nocardia cyriacigeorgica TaxID=135487 RepID=UPI0002DD6DA3|nr:hypothetical protein [Nocardia cyriacigeorgica]AVH21085.1 hypothetical protein C5B73_05960 [Nocardia cyriacigeorgica]MBF6087439.1 hypothetical protein [Nocardia cyriacigeorgica]MBF6092631.1 hypothetical protein [Nocardia cyriacigeorgica]MBF6325586.1 hypothetical protein [Nocardia cyriacigeorgica]MBF6413533.1 hypothetical protein [Nocardia cyriacigeorgica]